MVVAGYGDDDDSNEGEGWCLFVVFFLVLMYTNLPRRRRQILVSKDCPGDVILKLMYTQTHVQNPNFAFLSQFREPGISNISGLGCVTFSRRRHFCFCFFLVFVF